MRRRDETRRGLVLSNSYLKAVDSQYQGNREMQMRLNSLPREEFGLGLGHKMERASERVSASGQVGPASRLAVSARVRQCCPRRSLMRGACPGRGGFG